MKRHVGTKAGDALVAACAEVAFRELDADVRAWLALNSRESALLHEIQELMDDRANENVARQLHESKELPGTTVQDFRNRILHLGNGHVAIAGIRFRNGRREHPFVKVLARSFELSDEGALDRLMRVVRVEFRSFSPRHLGMRVASVRLPPKVQLRAVADFRYIAGDVSYLRSQDLSTPFVGTIRAMDVMATYEAYVTCYREWHRANPHLAEMASPECRESVHDCAKSGLAFEAICEGQVVGWVMARPSSEFGMQGYCVVDILRDTQFVGRGVATAMLRHLIEHVANDSCSYVFAHVHPRNVASLRCLNAVGMKEVGCFALLDLTS